MLGAAHIRITQSRFAYNYARTATALWSSDAASISIDGATFLGVSAPFPGSALALFRPLLVNVSSSVFVCDADSSGVVFIESSGRIVLSNVSVTNCSFGDSSFSISSIHDMDIAISGLVAVSSDLSVRGPVSALSVTQSRLTNSTIFLSLDDSVVDLLALKPSNFEVASSQFEDSAIRVTELLQGRPARRAWRRTCYFTLRDSTFRALSPDAPTMVSLSSLILRVSVTNVLFSSAATATPLSVVALVFAASVQNCTFANVGGIRLATENSSAAVLINSRFPGTNGVLTATACQFVHVEDVTVTGAFGTSAINVSIAEQATILRVSLANSDFTNSALSMTSVRRLFVSNIRLSDSFSGRMASMIKLDDIGGLDFIDVAVRNCTFALGAIHVGAGVRLVGSWRNVSLLDNFATVGGGAMWVAKPALVPNLTLAVASG